MRAKYDPRKAVETALAIITQGASARLENPVEEIAKATKITPETIRRGLNKLQKANQLTIVVAENSHGIIIERIQLKTSLQKHLENRFNRDPNIQEEAKKIWENSEFLNQKKAEAKIQENVEVAADANSVSNNGNHHGFKVSPLKKKSDTACLPSNGSISIQIADPDLPVLKAGSQSAVVAIVDYDNVKASERELGYKVSFKKMKEMLQGMGGQVYQADVFLSQNSVHPRVSKRLWDCGWRAIACPPEFKDKDSVDMKIILDINRFLSFPGITTVVLFSSDADFDHLPDLAADMGKQLILIDNATTKKYCSGEDNDTDLRVSRKTREFIQCIRHLRENYQPEYGRQKRICRLITIACNFLSQRNDNKGFGFKSLSSDLKKKLWGSGFNDFNVKEFDSLVRAFMEEGIIYEHIGNTGVNGRSVLFINTEHSLIKPAVPNAMVQGR